MSHSTSNEKPFVRAGVSAGALVGVLVVLSAMLAGCLEPPLPPGFEIAQELPPSVTPTATWTPTPEWPPTWTPTPTYTPWPTRTPTPTPTLIPTLPVPSSVGFRQAACSGVSQGPLKIDFQINPAWCPGGAAYVADATISASGGDGCYIYYRDIDKIEGPTRKTSVSYQIKWARCGGAPGTFFVQSGDGQVAAAKFWVPAPSCCKEKR